MKSMKWLGTALFCGLAVFSSWSMAEQMDLDEMAEAIRNGDIDVGKQYDMNKKSGRFHLIHSETIGLECEACHVAPKYAPDYLLVDKDNAEAKAAHRGKGPEADVLDRAVCLGCHKTNGPAHTWYRTADK